MTATPSRRLFTFCNCGASHATSLSRRQLLIGGAATLALGALAAPGIMSKAAAADAKAKAELTTALTLLKELSSVLGLFRKPVGKRALPGSDGLTDQLMTLLIELRAEARRTKNFSIADKIRDGLTAMKITLEDRPDGTKWRRDS